MKFSKFLLIVFCFLTLLVNISSKEKVLPVAILGGGVGSMTSAIYLARSGVKPIIIEGKMPGGMITQSHLVENWPSEKEISGANLADKIKKQAESLGCVFYQEEVISVDFSKKPFKITIRDVLKKENVRNILADSVIIGMGCSIRKIDIPGAKKDEYFSKGVSYCAVCDGPLYKNKNVAVIGGGESAIIEASYLSNIAKKVFLIVRRDNLKVFEKGRLEKLLSRSNVELLTNTVVEEIKGDGDKVTHLISKNIKENVTKNIDIDAVFLACGTVPNTEIFKGKLQLDNLGYIKLKNPNQETSISGVYAIGDIANPEFKQAICAASDGTKAALQVQKFLDACSNIFVKNEKVEKPDDEKVLNSMTEITSEEEFNNFLKNTKKPIFIDFYATWCRPCKRVMPIYYDFSEKMIGKVVCLKIDVSKFPELAEKYQIKAMPTMIVVKNEKEIYRKTGTEKIAKFFDKVEKGKIDFSK